MHRIASVTLWMSVVLASIIAFQLFVVIDEERPAGTRRSFDVQSVEAPTKDAAIDAMSAAAEQLGRNIYKVHPDPRNSAEGRILFVFVGDEDAFTSNGGYDYPTFFAQAMATRVLDADAITTEDLRGRYVTDATADEMPALLGALEEAGMTAREGTVPVLGLLLYVAGQGNLGGSFAVMVVALGLAISYSVACQRKVYALKALHGYRRADDLRAEVVAASRTLGVGLAVLVVVGVPVLGLVTQFHQALGFLRVLAGTFAVLYAVVVMLVVVAVLTLPSAHVPVVLKGERMSLRVGLLAAGAQIIVLAIVLATSIASLGRVEAVEASLDTSRHWETGDPLYALRLSVAGGSGEEDQRRAAPGLGAVVAEMEAAGQVLLAVPEAHYKDEGGAGEGGQGADGTGHMLLIVNDEYLERQVVHDAEGRRIGNLPQEPNTFTLLVPSGREGDAQALLDEYVAYFGDFTCMVGPPAEGATCDAQGEVVLTAPGQDLFTYGGTAYLPAEMQQEGLFVEDPVVAVVSAASGLISPLLYVSYASRDRLLFSEPDVLDAGLQERGARDAFQGIDNAADAVATSVALAQRELRMDVFSLALGWTLLVLSAIVMVVVYCDRRKRPMFVGLIHGHPFTARHARYLVGAVALSGAGIGLAAVAGGVRAAPRDLAVATVFLVIQVAVAVVSIRIYESRFRADLIKRY